MPWMEVTVTVLLVKTLWDVVSAECAKDAGMINIHCLAGLYGMYMPDAIAQYQAKGKTYLVTANEGDAP